ncbi:outer membrane protein [Bacteroides sp. CAG:545]|nr:outer membrane protein [Bacteroides sp. CAG:545]
MKKVILIAAAALMTLSASAQNLKFAHVNFNELVMLQPAADSARAQLAASQQDAQDTFKSMQDELQAKYSQYQQKANTWTPAIRESKEKELQDIQNRIEEFNQSIQQELQQQQSQLMAPIQQKAVEVVHKLAKEGGFIYVFEEGSLLYVDKAQSVDLTPAARKALNIPEGRTLETLQQELQAKQQ